MKYTVSNIDLKTLFILIFLFIINIWYKKYIKLKKNLSVDIDYYKNSFINHSLDFFTAGIRPPGMRLHGFLFCKTFRAADFSYDENELQPPLFVGGLKLLIKNFSALEHKIFGCKCTETWKFYMNFNEFWGVYI